MIAPKTTIAVLIVFFVIAAFVIGVLWTKVQYLEKGGTKTAVPTGPAVAGATAGKIKEISDNDHIRGDKNAKVTLVEYSDLECSFCKSFHPTMQQALKEYDGKIRWVYRHLPIDQIHPRARPAALASECVANLGGNDKFWDYIDKLFEGAPSTLTDGQLTSIAASLGIDQTRFSSCFASKQFENRIEQDLQDAQAGGLRISTPQTIVIDAKGNTQLIPGAVPYENIKQAVEEALKN